MLILNSIICKMCSSRKYCIRTSTQRVGLCLNHFPPQMYNIKASRSCSQWKWETRIASSNQRVSYLLFTLIYSSGSFQHSTMQIAISVKKDCLEPETYQAWHRDITFFLSMKSGKFCWRLTLLFHYRWWSWAKRFCHSSWRGGTIA